MKNVNIVDNYQRFDASTRHRFLEGALCRLNHRNASILQLQIRFQTRFKKCFRLILVVLYIQRLQVAAAKKRAVKKYPYQRGLHFLRPGYLKLASIARYRLSKTRLAGHLRTRPITRRYRGSTTIKIRKVASLSKGSKRKHRRRRF